jgi:hypothetical protein
LKLTIKVRDKIVADGLNDETSLCPTLEFIWKQRNSMKS